MSMDEFRSVQQGGSVILLRENVEEYQDLVRDVATAPGLNPLLAAVTRKISAAMGSVRTRPKIHATPMDRGFGSFVTTIFCVQE